MQILVPVFLNTFCGNVKIFNGTKNFDLKKSSILNFKTLPYITPFYLWGKKHFFLRDHFHKFFKTKKNNFIEKTFIIYEKFFR